MDTMITPTLQICKWDAVGRVGISMSDLAFSGLIPWRGDLQKRRSCYGALVERILLNGMGFAGGLWLVSFIFSRGGVSWGCMMLCFHVSP